MRYNVVCGDYAISIDRSSACLAAFDAIGLWKHMRTKPSLARVVLIEDERKKVVYMATSSLVAQYGLEIKDEQKTDKREMA